MPRLPLAPAAAGLLVVAAAACAPDNTPDTATGPAVVAAFYPLQVVAERVGGTQVAVTSLAQPGAEPHDLELSPSQVGEVGSADLVVYLTDFQPAVDAAVDAHAPDHSFDVTTAVPLLDAAAEPEHDEHEDEAEHEEEHEDEAEHEEDEHEHEHGDVDPHVWLDPTRLATIGDELAVQLGDLDPDHADEYTTNADALRDDLETLDAEYTEGLADCERREIVVSHAAFGYLADRYDLRQIAITGLSPEDEPTPQRLQDVIHEAEEVGATTIFFEVLVAPDVAETIARETGADTAVLDPIEGLAPDSDDDYLSLMRQNLETLRTALGCV